MRGEPDIVEMLHEWCEEDHTDHDNCIHCVAANEIDRLRNLVEVFSTDGSILLLPGLKWLVERTNDCDSDCVHAPMCRKWDPTCDACGDTGLAVSERIGPTGDPEQYEGACPNGCAPDGWADTRIIPHQI